MSKGKDAECGISWGISDLVPQSAWHQGYCAEYAMALVGRNPQLRLGFSAAEDFSVDWDPYSDQPPPFEPGAICHVFAHDQDYAYDVLGRHLLPYFHPWEAGFVPQAEHNYLHYDQQGLIEVLAEHWAPRTGETVWSPDQSMLDIAAGMAQES